MGAWQYADVAPDVLGPATGKLYTYRIPPGMNLKAGSAVIVPFGSRSVVGFVIRLVNSPQVGVDVETVREIRSHIESYEFPESLVDLLEWTSREFLTPIASVVAAAAPPGIRSRLATSYSLLPGSEQVPLTKPQEELIALLKESGGSVAASKLGTAKSGKRSAARALVRAGALEERVFLTPEQKRRARLLELASHEHVDEFVSHYAKRRPAQVACLVQLRAANAAQFTADEIARHTESTPATVAELIDAGLLIKARTKAPETGDAPKSLTPEQQRAVDALRKSVISQDGNRFLLFGVTGSGKTEVYFRAATEALSAGKQVLYLVPEIALTPQVVSLLRGRFGDSVAIMHSAMSAGERLRQWRSIQRGEAPIVVGARSSIFAPLDKIGLIVVDEEHESTYKQETMPRYHVRSLAEHRAAFHNATLVLGSATPSIESFQRARTGNLQLLTLTRRATDLELPTVTTVDLREDFKTGKPALLSEPLRDAMRETLERNEQVMLFLNRRAYAHALICRECGACPKCPNCSVALVFHQKAREIRCHHCGHKQPAPNKCPSCQGNKIRPFGVGTERVEEAVRAEFPNLVCARLDRDISVRKGATEDILSRFRSGDIQVLVGTQMIAKGLDFPNVSLVGVITADVGLAVPDFRSTERTFQLLTQVAGRSGRHKPGSVIIQSFQPRHPAIVSSITHDYASFFESEIEDRVNAQYPPFVRLINIIASSENSNAALKTIMAAASYYRALPNISVMGPADCPIARLNGKWRKHILVKFAPRTPTSELALPDAFKPAKGCTLTLDVDPMSLV